MSDVDHILGLIGDLSPVQREELIDKLVAQYLPDKEIRTRSSGPIRTNRVDLRNRVNEWLEERADNEKSITPTAEMIQSFLDEFGLKTPSSFYTWAKNLGYKLTSSHRSIDESGGVRSSRGSKISDEPCTVNTLAQKIYELTSEEVIDYLSPLDRNNLKSELQKAINRIDAASQEKGSQ